MGIREEEEIKGIQIGKVVVKLSLFVHNLIIHIENPTDASRKLLSSLVNSVKFQDTKLIHRSILHSYTLTTKDEKEKLRKQSHSPSHQKG